jgi:prepilin-type N-terminal cleavage/methylation domain-containing protein
MQSRRWDRRGVSLVELMIAVVVIGVLCAGAVRADVYLTRRAMEHVVTGDLDAYAQAQMEQRTEGGRFIAHDQLVAQGFEWSDDVELSEARIADDRFFVRIRHARSGYACSLDLSPATARARNRKICRATVSDPALAQPPGIIITPPGADTQTVVRPPVVPPPRDGQLLPPEVGDLGEVVLDPGTERVLVFPVQNRSGESRLFSFGTASANPSVVPHPDVPADARMESAETAMIPVRVAVAPGTLADQGADVELRANDTGDRTYSGSGSVRVRAALVLVAPLVGAPAAEVRDPGETFTVQYRLQNRSNATRTFRMTVAIPAGSALSSGGPIPDQVLAPREERAFPVTYRLAASAEGGSPWTSRVTATDRDAAEYVGTSSEFTAVARLVLADPLVGAPAATSQPPASEFQLVWQVTNRSNAEREFRFTPGGASQGLTPVGAPFTRRLRHGESTGVSVTYRMSGSATCGEQHVATLRVEDAAAPAYAAAASAPVSTATALSSPMVVAPAARSDQPGAAFTVAWQVTNQSNCARDIGVDALPDGDVEVTGITGGGVLRMQPFEQRTVEAVYRLRDRSVFETRSRPTLRVTDEGDSRYAAAASFVETTALKLCAPAVEGPLTAAPQPQQPGSPGTVLHRITNCSNAPRTFALPVSSSNAETVPDPLDPASVSIPAYGAAEVPYAYVVAGVAPGGSFSDLVLRAVDAGDADLSGGATFRAIAAVVVRAPFLAPLPNVLLMPGTQGSSEALLTSRSNIPVDVCFAPDVAAGTAAAGAVVDAAPATGCIRVAPYASQRVAQQVTAAAGAEHPHTNSVLVRAFDSARPELYTTLAFQVTADLALASPLLQVPATPPAVIWMMSQDRSIGYPVTNRTNSVRRVCLAVAPAGPELVAATPSTTCASVPAGAQHVFTHSLRGNAAGETSVGVSAYDSLAPSYSAAGTFAARVVDARPVAVWTPPSPVYVRKWAEFDASRSFSPIGAPIVKYVWSWGLFNQRWNGARFEPAPSGVATDELPEPITRRAWDSRGTFQVCLAVEDGAGRRSAPACAPVTTLLETRARLAFRYRGWWHDPRDFCLDVPWDNQCPDEHGNARWEILLDQSQGDVPIKRAWADVRVNYWQTDDELNRVFTYAGNAEALPFSFAMYGSTVTYDFFLNRHKASGSVQTGRWRILDTDGTAALGWPATPDLHRHPLIVNANLGSATGWFDGGPHWVPDEVWITLHVEDARGQVTQQSSYLNHDKGQWRGAECINGTNALNCVRGYERLTPQQSGPWVSVEVQNQDGTFRFTGSGGSTDGRVVDSWWEITSASPLTGRETSVHRGDTFSVSPAMCEVVDVLLVYVDDLGQQARASERVSGPVRQRCDALQPPQ